MPLPIEDYALIGDTRSAALVGRNGSIDWLCLPRFDSEACFTALLGSERHGRWLLAPRDAAHGASRRYRPDSLVLETTFEAREGAMRVTDCMPPHNEHSTLIRIVEGLRGRLVVRSELAPRFGYGSRTPWLQRQPDGHISATAGPDTLVLQSTVPAQVREATIESEFSVEAGTQVAFTLAWHPSHAPPPPWDEAARAVQATDDWWHRWVGRCCYSGRWRGAVVRSLITLKALTYSPTGGIVAAPTTSLPEALGSVRNWDYRFCWLRDATLTLVTLLDAGYQEEAAAWRDWLLRAVAGEPEELQFLYGVAGERRLTELELPWLPGYQGSQPVRTGNAAWQQLQLDVFGEVMDCLYQARLAGLPPEPNAWALQCHLLEHIESIWNEPDEGIWEVRGPRRHFTHSKVMAWVALDRTIRAAERFGLRSPLERWRALRTHIHETVCRYGYDRELNSFVQSFDSRALDASLLMIPMVGFLPPDDPRVVSTVRAIQRGLCEEGLVYRYDTRTGVDRLPSGEGVFLACSFWLVDALQLIGQRAEATALFEHLLALCNDVGLLSEEYDVRNRRFLGNFPQALSHLFLVECAENLERAEGTAQPRCR